MIAEAGAEAMQKQRLNQKQQQKQWQTQTIIGRKCSRPKSLQLHASVGMPIEPKHETLQISAAVISAVEKNSRRKTATEAEEEAEGWAGRVQGDNNCSPLSDDR